MSDSRADSPGGTGAWPLLGPTAFLVAILLVNPAGAVAVNDDFSYAWTVRHWVERGSLELHDWTSMSLLAHAAWGALWSLFAGFSHTALRLSTVALATVGVAGVYGVARELGLARQTAALASVVVAWCPLHLVLSATFMTDVPFLAWMVVGLWATLRWRRTDACWAWGIVLFAAVSATLTRQLGLALGIGLVLTTVRGRRRWWGMVPLVVSVGALGSWLLWLESTNAVPELFHARERDLARAWDAGWATPVAAIERACLALLYAGLLGAPLVVTAVGARFTRRELGVAGGVVTLSATVLWRLERWMPALPHWFRADGLGPNRLLGADELGSSAPVALGILLTGIALVGAAVVVVGGVRAWRRRPESRLVLFVLAVYFAPIAVTAVFDRYLLLPIAVLPLVAVAGLDRTWELARWARWALAPLLLSGLIVGVLGTRRFLDWNRVAWEEAERLVRAGTPREHIDAGVAWNGWWLSRELPADRPRTSASWWWVGDDRHVISFTPLTGYTVERRRELGSPLWGPSEIFVLRRDDD